MNIPMHIHIYKENTKTGFSLIEALVSITLLLIALVGPMTFFVRSSQSAEVANDRVIATFLAQEGAELIQLKRDKFVLGGFNALFTGDGLPDVWGEFKNAVSACTESSGCGVHLQDDDQDDNTVRVASCEILNDCTLSYDSDRTRSKYHHNIAGNETFFTRVVSLDFSDDNSVNVISRVSWRSSALRETQHVETVTTLFNIYQNIWQP